MSDLVSFFDWYSTSAIKAKPWLILGKGPSYAKHEDYDLTAFNVVSLNHVVGQLKVDFSHMIDLDVFDACQNAIDENCLYLVMPWVPHQDNRPGSQNLADLIKTKPFMAKLAKEKRLLFYNHVPDQCFGNSPVVRVRYFSAEAVVNLLALCGASTIRTLGIDGGASYSDSFSHLNKTTLLSNGRESFDRQFGEIAKTIFDFNMDFAPLNIQSPVKIYVATTEAQMLSVKVLEYSIRKHASMSVEIIPLHLSKIEIPTPRESKNHPRTPFSFQRLLIPQLQKYEGRAIYLDSDMQVFKDIKDIWVQPFNNAQILTVKNSRESDRRPQFSVMLMDCSNLNWEISDLVSKLDCGSLTYERLMHEMSIVDNIRAQIDSAWNSLESYNDGETALLHYTDMNTQPWVSIHNPFGYLWFRDLFEAINAGFISKELVKNHINHGYIRPSIMYQLEHGIEDSLLLPNEAKILDSKFIAPYMTMRIQDPNPIKYFTILASAHARHLKNIARNKFVSIRKNLIKLSSQLK